MPDQVGSKNKHRFRLCFWLVNFGKTRNPIILQISSDAVVFQNKSKGITGDLENSVMLVLTSHPTKMESFYLLSQSVKNLLMSWTQSKAGLFDSFKEDLDSYQNELKRAPLPKTTRKWRRQGRDWFIRSFSSFSSPLYTYQRRDPTGRGGASILGRRARLPY